MSDRDWFGPFESFPDAITHRVTEHVGADAMYVCDTFGRWFVVRAERIENFAGFIARRSEREQGHPMHDERGPWLA